MDPKKFVVVLNKSLPLERMTSALGHVMAGVSASIDDENRSLVTYEDADGQSYPAISDWPVIILRGGPGQLKNYREKLVQAGLPAVTYLNTMYTGGSGAQQEATRGKSTEELEFVAVATFGLAVKVDSLTKKFSVWK